MGKKKASLVPAAAAIDPTLDALFSSSAGPLKVPSASRYSALLEKKEPPPVPKQSSDDEDSEEPEGDDEELSEVSEEFDDGGSDEQEESQSEDYDDEDEEEEQSSESEREADDADEDMEEGDEPPVHETLATEPPKERKRKRKDENDDLEDRYMTKLIREDEPEGKRRRATPEAEKSGDEEDSDDAIPVHESLAQDDKTSEIDKANRTVFLANVSSSAITSKSAKKTLLAHLTSIFPSDDPAAPKVESLRFRSVAFSEMSMPKRAAYITGSLLGATTQSTNAYAVYSTAPAARKAAAELNGTTVLERHLRVDSVAHPTPTDHRRCVFVGNLGFVDDETVVRKDENGETTEKKRNKVPADVEEGLWRTFGAQGKVENVRVVRDPKTRVGKGFAYVQFYDANAVESALLLDGKKFPPMLPRALRVTRAKDPRKTALAQERSLAKAVAQATKNTKYKYKPTPEEQSMAGRTGKLLGRSAVFQQRKGGEKGRVPRGAPSSDAGPTMKTPEQIVFEGRRVSIKDTMPTDLKGKKKGKGKKPPGKPQNRGARRGAEWKKKQMA
ncbi:RNA recognition motif domain-containing protein [Sarocladium implicatum]|nr:RNA recognition motif domain-containing protein [Sarocladium implicatum]